MPDLEFLEAPLDDISAYADISGDAARRSFRMQSKSPSSLAAGTNRRAIGERDRKVLIG
jgi:hypothetical protein